MSNKIISSILSFLLFAAVAEAQVETPVVSDDVTINYDSIDEEMYLSGDTTLKSRRNIAKQQGDFSALDYVMGKRHRVYGDTFTKRWDDHLYLQFGVGLEQVAPSAKNYGLDALTTGHFGIGKDLNKYHSLRATINGALGYVHKTDEFYIRLGGRLDHLFNLSSYFNGYKPDRLLEVSSVLGIGAHYSRLGGAYQRKGRSFEARGGLQLKFFSGPQGYFNIEPYLSLTTDNYDLAGNWRRYELVGGANVNVVYYLHNNLSKEARLKYLRENPEALVADSTRHRAWEAPFFLELSNGLMYMDAPKLKSASTVGHNIRISAGKWFSPVVGVRFSAMASTFTWDKEKIPESLSPVRPAYTKHLHSFLYGLRAEAMINPLGFSKDFSWDDPFGFHVVAGGELGWIMKEQKRGLSCNRETYTAGVQVWANLNGGMRLFVEPRYSYSVYKIPYKNVDWSERFSDDNFNLNLGLSFLMRSRKYLSDKTKSDTDFHSSKLMVGLGAGFPLMSTDSHYEGESTLDWTTSLYALYKIDRISGIRLGLDYLSIKENIMSKYIDYNLNYPEANNIPTHKEGLWNRKFRMKILTLDYSANFTNLFSKSFFEKRWNLEVYAGPAFCIMHREHSKLADAERQQPNHKYVLKGKVGRGTAWGANGGFNLSYRFNENISAFASPTFYVFRRFSMPLEMTRKAMFIENINFGIQYSL